ncbi:MAG: hypothetical protein LBJ67_14485 [Planctomycetaceae bacterium]|jgi:hypothetical protein|nr:hypothetical protein [Planctomycetaceae bacterium]
MNDTQLDKHSVTIRKRSVGELFDLTLAVFRTEGLSILFWFSIFLVPLALLDHVLVSHFIENWLLLDSEEDAYYIAYVLLLIFFIPIQTPFVSSLLIVYLGKRMFMSDIRPRKAEVFIMWLEALPQLILYTFFLLPLILLYDNLPEIVVLERAPLFRHKKDRVTTFRRLQNFHRNRFGEQFVIFTPLFLFGVVLIPALILITGYLLYLCVGSYSVYPNLYCAVVTPVVCWTIMMFLVVFHFLRYINMRIEREGWDVELIFRAERSRLKE